MTDPSGSWPEDLPAPDADDRHRSERDGRRLCLEAVFEADFGQRTAREVLERRIEETAADPVAAAHARRLVDAVVRDRDSIDAAIERAAPAYPVVQLARIDRSLLRSAMGELLHCAATPTRVAISEWVELGSDLQWGIGPAAPQRRARSGRSRDGPAGTLRHRRWRRPPQDDR